jgi:hypothetical protein
MTQLVIRDWYLDHELLSPFAVVFWFSSPIAALLSFIFHRPPQQPSLTKLTPTLD